MLCEVEAGAIVMAPALRSVGWYVVVSVANDLYVMAPASGVAPDHATPNRSVPVNPVVPNAVLGEPDIDPPNCKLVRLCSKP